MSEQLYRRCITCGGLGSIPDQCVGHGAMACGECRDGYIAADIPSELAAVTAERDDLQASADLRWKADMRAIKQWHDAGGDKMTWPDHADLCCWLATTLATVTAERDQLLAALPDFAKSPVQLDFLIMQRANDVAAARKRLTQDTKETT